VVTPSLKYKFAANHSTLSVDLSADEHGRIVHESCYVSQIAGQRGDPAATMIAD
jgi:hypothetical protein